VTVSATVSAAVCTFYCFEYPCSVQHQPYFSAHRIGYGDVAQWHGQVRCFELPRHVSGIVWCFRREISDCRLSFDCVRDERISGGSRVARAPPIFGKVNLTFYIVYNV